MRPGLRALALLAVDLAAGAGFARGQGTTTRVLPNGIHLIAVSSTDRTTTIESHYLVGSRDEGDGQRGLAHLTEHLAMRETRSGVSLAVEIARRGWSGGASTAEWSTGFSVSAESADSATLAAMLRLERQRMTDLAIDSIAVQTETRRVRIEVGSAPERVAAHRDLEGLKTSDVKAFYERRYVPSNVVISIRTSLPVDQVLSLATTILGTIPAGTVPAGGIPRDSVRREIIRRHSTASGTTPTAKPSWNSPDTLEVQWRDGIGATRWVATLGGIADTVFFAAVVAAPSDLTVPDIALLEVLARRFSDIRLPDGRTLQSAIASLGGTLTAQPRPFPPLATTDRFRMLGTPVTPIGSIGIQLVGAVPRSNAAAVVRLIGAALAAGRLDSLSATSELARQQELLARAGDAHALIREVTFRRVAPVLSADAPPTARPEALSAQRDVIERLAWHNVNRIRSTLMDRGTVRLALLGVDADTVAGWLQSEAWPVFGGAWRAAETPRCPHREGEVIRAGSTGATVQMHFGLCLPVRGTEGVPAALLVTNAILGGREDALLAARLRGTTGLVYGMAARLVPTDDGRSILWELEVSTQGTSTAAVVEEVRRILGRLQREGVPIEVVREYRDWLAMRRLSQGTSSGIAWVTGLVSTGRSPEQEAAAIRAVTDADVRATWSAFAPGRLVIVSP